jgi:hypothetical protein
LYKRNVDPTAKCPAFVRQLVAVESQPVDGELDVDIDLDVDHSI